MPFHFLGLQHKFQLLFFASVPKQSVTVCIFKAFRRRFCMKYPISIGKKHNNGGLRRDGRAGSTKLTLYGYTEDLQFTSERISSLGAFFLNHWIWPRLYGHSEVECDSCLETRSILSKRLPNRWECTKCLQSEPEIAFI